MNNRIPPLELREWIVVTNRDSKVIFSTSEYQQAKNFANLMRQAGAEVSVFKRSKA